MYAIIRDGSRQCRVEKGLELDLDRKKAEPGAKVEFGEVLLLHDGKSLRVGRPTVEGAKVLGEVVKEVRDVKLRIHRFRRREIYRRTLGHRQKLTRVRITEIVAP